ncbi:MAG: apolipoprotein N-acyltransferase [Polyangiaceae bacterium]
MNPLVKSGWAASGLAVLSGLLYFLAFPGLDWWPLAFIAFVPLWIALQGSAPKRAFGLAWLSGFTMTMAGFYWLLSMLQNFSGFPTALCLVFMSLLCAYQAGRIGVLGWLYGRAAARGWPKELVFVLAFAASEFLFPLLFPWYFGATLQSVPLLLQTAELGGPIIVGVVLVCANLGLAEPLLARLEGRSLRRDRILIHASIVIAAVAYGAVRIPFVDAAVARAPKANVGLVQANMSLMGKRRELAEGLRRHLNLTAELRQRGPLDFVVWSETSVMRAVDEEVLLEVVPNYVGRHIGVPAIFGAVIVRDVGGARQYVAWNSALSTGKSGAVTGRYDKQFLVTFSEYIPFGDQLPILYEWSPNSGRFSPGKRIEPLPIDGHPVATIICYEDLSPSFVNSLFRHKNAQLLVNMTNDAWFGDTIEPYQHFAISKLRAVEQRRYFVRSTNSGVSAVVDPVGRTLFQTKTFTATSFAAQVAWLEGTTIYRMLGDFPMWLASLASVVLAFLRRRRPA